MQSQIPKQTRSSLLARLDGANTALLIVDGDRQKLLHFEVSGEQELACYPISTASAGFGNKPDSFMTPLGWHQVREVIGEDATTGQAFVSRKPEGTPLPEEEWAQEQAEDLILTRILRLAGMERKNASTWSRHVYIHGTNQEQLLGQPSSHGCIRMGNRDIVELAGRLADADAIYCWIGELLPEDASES